MALTTLLHLVASIGVLGCICHYIIQKIHFRAKYKFPNPVPGLPIVGNMLQVPKEDSRMYFAKLAKQYGEMYTLKLGTNRWVFLNSSRVVNDIMEKRASIYVSRQNLPMAGDIVSGGNRLLFLPHNELWKRERKIMHETLGPASKDRFAPSQDIETRTLLHDYLTRPEQWHHSHSRYSSSVIMNVVFGRRTKLGDKTVNDVVDLQEHFLKLLEPGASFIDAFPILMKTPIPQSWQPWRWWGDTEYRRTKKVFEIEMDRLLQHEKNGTASDCWMSQLIRSGKDKEFTRDQLLFMAGTLIEAGTDTTRISLNQLAAGSALFPDWIERARKELDAVCGSNAERLPVPEDAPSLPLIRAAAKESLRWNPSLGEIAHSLTQDDSYEGYHFPAGTNVTWNHWAIAMDPNEYPEPERFYPDRFLNEDLDKPTKGHFGFGVGEFAPYQGGYTSGRRVCAGYVVANRNLFLSISRLVYCFDFLPVEGHPIPVGKPFSTRIMNAPFQIKIRVRSPAHEALIRRECTSAAFD
ncbi:uncharacterized protein A1O9_00875 [Exophiala aquamarina CBS 119918]|uniref:Cytochrome P450 n=1 Tax=Exophiala aquamarina CBS 119918 TaxID=1182545 RepID=A0A072PSQ1_9EURO|nr:uncharacterized protein A1O9_00875 [Exophiala aquamarina CBS 119918]KEF62901.1 hypothetical protein A1O9_00875 [Exophiala aquamarina CBS 119918]